MSLDGFKTLVIGGGIGGLAAARALAMAAAVKAASATGGVTLESWLSQKMIMCAESSAAVAAPGGTT